MNHHDGQADSVEKLVAHWLANDVPSDVEQRLRRSINQFCHHVEAAKTEHRQWWWQVRHSRTLKWAALLGGPALATLLVLTFLLSPNPEARLYAAAVEALEEART